MSFLRQIRKIGMDNGIFVYISYGNLIF